MSKIRVIYMGKNKPEVLEGLKFLLQNDFEIVAVVGISNIKNDSNSSSLVNFAIEKNLKVVTEEFIYNELNKKIKFRIEFLKDVDLVISYLFWNKIKKSLIELPRLGCVNFHPAPLPDFRGVSPYSFGILENVSCWGVSAHFVDESFDTGDIIKIKKFNIKVDSETAFSLEQKSQKIMLELFQETMKELVVKGKLPREHQDENGRYFSKENFEEMRKIDVNDTIEVINRKIRAFWYPPFDGASININNKEYTVINENILKDISELNKKNLDLKN